MSTEKSLAAITVKCGLERRKVAWRMSGYNREGRVAKAKCGSAHTDEAACQVLQVLDVCII